MVASPFPPFRSRGSEGAKTMTRKENAPAVTEAQGTSQKRDTPEYTDPLIGWHELGKPARLQRKPKRSWRRKGGGA